MPKSNKEEIPKRRRPPATTPEARENQLIERKNTYINKLLHNAMEGNIYLRYNQCIHAKFEFEERK